ncbi:MAG: hypothetical protein MJ071_04055 [Oscillospiraceae bacterium]|nr:hypothetical protein [Oscillospiraceae bacterium]
MAIQCYEIEYQNFGKCICLENGLIKLIAALDFGPRIVFFSTRGGRNILFEDINRDFCELNKGYGTWYAYGGHRLWIAPEVMPETYYPDNNRVTYSFTDRVLRLEAKPTAFGKQISLTITMSDDYTVKVRNIVRNVSDKPMLFAPWSITGLSLGGTEFIPLCRDNKGFLPNRTMALWSYSDINDPRFRLTNEYASLTHDPQNTKAFKMGCNVTDGYVVYITDHLIFRKTFEPCKDVQYPDFGCNFETYTNNHFLEMELLGEYRRYMPKEEAVIEETWEISDTSLPQQQVISSLIQELKA